MATPNERLRHEVARETAISLVNVIAAVLRPEEQIEACREFYAIVRAGLEAFEDRKSRLN